MVGDFNLPDIDWNDSNRPVLKTTRETNLHQLFVDFIISNNLSQVINKPTHDKGNTLDLVVTNVTTTNPRVESSCSDHSIINFNVLADNVIKRTASLTKPKPYWQFEKADITNITMDCYSLHCKITSDISKKCSAEQLWHNLKTGILQVAHSNIPYKFRKKKSELWISQETKREIRKRKDLHLACLNDRTPHNILKHATQSWYCKKLCNRDYNNYINKHIQTLLHAD